MNAQKQGIKANMNYLEAKTVLLNDLPQVPWRGLVIETAIMVSAAAALVRIFA